MACASLGTGKAHNAQGVKRFVVCPVIPSLLELPLLFLCYSWGGVGGIDSDSLHTLRASDSSQLWCSSKSAQNIVGALPQLPRSSQTHSDVLGSALNDTTFISKLDTHSRIKDSPATNRA